VHGFEGVHENVEKNLLDLLNIAHEGREPFVVRLADEDILPTLVRAEEIEDLVEEIVDVTKLEKEGGVLYIVEDFVEDRLEPGHLLSNDI
jgi:hypothetical protein